MRTAVEKLNDTGIILTNITCDNPLVNVSMMQKLGANFDDIDNMKVSLDVLNSANKNIYSTFDAVHLLKLIRNAFGDLKQFKDYDNNLVNWRYVVELHNLQEKEGLHVANKLRKAHVDTL